MSTSADGGGKVGTMRVKRRAAVWSPNKPLPEDYVAVAIKGKTQYILWSQADVRKYQKAGYAIRVNPANPTMANTTASRTGPRK